jgi:hypothetical protein
VAGLEGQFEQESGPGPVSDSSKESKPGFQMSDLIPDFLPFANRQTPREEITSALAHPATKELSQKEKKDLGEWLKGHFNKLLKNGTGDIPGMTSGDLVETYSSNRWLDGTKFLRADRRMMKQVAHHFQEIALAGKSAQVIEEEDIDGLARGAKVKRTEIDVTSTFPDGALWRRTNDGNLLRKEADGSLSFHASGVDMELKSNGQGYLKISMSGVTSQDLKLTRRSDGVWTGDLDGSELNLAVDEHSVRLTTSDMDMLLTSNGGFVRDPSDPSSGATFLNRDGSVTMVERNGLSAEIARGNNGVVLALVSDGSREVQYPINATLVNDGKGNISISSTGPIPHLVSTSEGELTVFLADKQTSAKPGADGNSVVVLESGTVVTRDKDGNITVSLPIAAVEDLADPLNEIPKVNVSFSPEGVLTVSDPFGRMAVLSPPEIKRPK